MRAEQSAAPDFDGMQVTLTITNNDLAAMRPKAAAWIIRTLSDENWPEFFAAIGDVWE